jgi:hypothetical protein
VAKVSPDILANFFNDLENDSSDLETYATGHPDMADDLSSLIEVAQSIVPPPEVSLELLTHARLRAGLLYQMAQTGRPSAKARKLSVREALRSLVGIVAGIERIPAMVTTAVIVLTPSFGGGVVFAAESALPGDTLYPVKLSFESVQLVLAPNDEARAEALVDLAYNRLTDLEKASLAGRAEATKPAVDSYTTDVSEASQLLSEPTASDQTVEVLTNRLETDLARHEGTLAHVELQSPSSVTSVALQSADDIQSALALAVARSQDRGQLVAATSQGSSRPASGPRLPVRSAASRRGLAVTMPTLGTAKASQPSQPANIAAGAPSSGSGGSIGTAALRPGGTPSSSGQGGSTGSGGRPGPTIEPPQSGQGQGSRTHDNYRHHPDPAHRVFNPKRAPPTRSVRPVKQPSSRPAKSPVSVQAGGTAARPAPTN